MIQLSSKTKNVTVILGGFNSWSQVQLQPTPVILVPILRLDLNSHMAT